MSEISPVIVRASRPGDVVFIELTEHLTFEQYNMMRAALKEQAPEIKCVILPPTGRVSRHLGAQSPPSRDINDLVNDCLRIAGVGDIGWNARFRAALADHGVRLVEKEEQILAPCPYQYAEDGWSPGSILIWKDPS